MKIVRLLAENFMRLEAVEIKPDGNTVLITGKNGAGKSSVLNAIFAVLCGKKYHPDKPIRDGADHAEIVIETENWIIKRTFTEAGGGSVTITNVDGMRAQSPQQLLNKIVGEIAFDPMEFIRMGKTAAGKKQQVELLKKMVGLDFSDLDVGIEDCKEERSNANEAKKRYEFEADDIVVSDDEDLPDEEVSMVALSAELQKAREHNEARQKMASDIEGLANDVEGFGGACEQMDNLVDRLNKQLAEDKKQHEEAKKQLKKQLAEKQERVHSQITEANEKKESSAKLQNSYLSRKSKLEADLKVSELPIDTEEITQKMGELESTNEFIRNKKQQQDLLAKASTEGAAYTRLGQKMKELELEKAKRLSEVKMPVEGLSVSDDCVTYKGIPLSQEGGAKQLEVSMAIAMEKNPDLRVIVMQGNELDDDSLKVVEKMVKDKDYQVWIERWSGDESGIIIEDGSVKE